MQVTILSGSIVRVWGVLEHVLQRHEHELNKADRSMRIIRVDLATIEQPDLPGLVGVRFPGALLGEACPRLPFSCFSELFHGWPWLWPE